MDPGVGVVTADDPGVPPDPNVSRAADVEGRLAMREVVDCLAEIIYGQGLRVPVYAKAVDALARLGVTKAPDVVTKAPDVKP